MIGSAFSATNNNDEFNDESDNNTSINSNSDPDYEEWLPQETLTCSESENEILYRTNRLFGARCTEFPCYVKDDGNKEHPLGSFIFIFNPDAKNAAKLMIRKAVYMAFFGDKQKAGANYVESEDKIQKISVAGALEMPVCTKFYAWVNINNIKFEVKIDIDKEKRFIRTCYGEEPIRIISYAAKSSFFDTLNIEKCTDNDIFGCDEIYKEDLGIY